VDPRAAEARERTEEERLPGGRREEARHEGRVRDVTYHALRHTAATLLLAGGADVKAARRSSVTRRASHTLDLYADSVPGNVSVAMAKLGGLN
jgi:integrase